MKILMALQVKLVEGEQALVRARGTNNFEAYEKFLQATEQHYLFYQGGRSPGPAIVRRGHRSGFRVCRRLWPSFCRSPG